MDTLYLLDIGDIPKGHAKRAFGQHKCVQHLFEIQGEKRVVAVVKGDAGLGELSDALNVYTVHCTPLIPYEQFATQTLGLQESEVEKKAPPAAFQPGKEIYWTRTSIGYAGHTLDDLMKAGHEEAVAVLNIVHGGQVPMVLYKSVGMREVNIFLQMEAAVLDMTSFTLPIIKSLGDQVNSVTKSIRVPQ